jgi:ribosomal protein S12 methylthiotransferase accessory factor
MEGIELFCAEEEDRFPFSVIKASYNDLVSEGIELPDIELLPLSLHSLFGPSSRERWVLGWDIIGQREMAVPFEAVTMVSALGDVPSTFSFQIGSNGLASGNVFLEAICSALYEVIERDAVTNSNILANHNLSSLDRLEISTIPYDNVQELADRLQLKGITPILFDCTVDTQVPTYEAYLLDRDIPSTGVFRGYGSHLHPEVAMLRALTEAVQSRTVYIAGSRDDMMNFEHRRLKMTRNIEDSTYPHANELEFSQVSKATSTFQGDCQVLLDSLTAVGIESAVVLDLSWPEFGVSVVRIVVPGLEGYGSFPYYRPGPRAKAAARIAESRRNNVRSTRVSGADI